MQQSEYFLNRHTVRNFKESPISNNLLKQMLEAASHAPNTGNMQWYSVIVTRAADKKAALAPTHFSQPAAVNADVLLTFCIDLRRFEHWSRINKAQPGFDNFQSFIAAAMDASLFAQQFCTIAEMNGIGTCYLGTTAYNAPQIAEVLELPERVIPLITVAAGYPVEEGKPSLRLPIGVVMHRETYHDATDDEIRDAYKEIEADSQHFVDENHKQTLAQVFTDIRYPRQSSEQFSKIYLDFLAKNKFDFTK